MADDPDRRGDSGKRHRIGWCKRAGRPQSIVPRSVRPWVRRRRFFEYGAGGDFPCRLFLFQQFQCTKL